MKTIFIFCVFYLVIMMGCTSKQSQNKNVKSTEIDSTIDLQSRSSVMKPSANEIYSFIEQTFESQGRLIRTDSLTTKKELKSKIDSIEREIIIYHQKNRLISAWLNYYNNTRERIGFQIFQFGKDNKCLLYSVYANKESCELDYAILRDFLIQSDCHNNSIVIEGSEKQEIIRSTKASLDSVMQFFPEFQYTFNWENYLTKQ